MTLTQLATKTGIPRETLKYWRRKGLIEPLLTDDQGRTQYPHAALAHCRRLRQTGKNRHNKQYYYRPD